MKRRWRRNSALPTCPSRICSSAPAASSASAIFCKDSKPTQNKKTPKRRSQTTNQRRWTKRSPPIEPVNAVLAAPASRCDPRRDGIPETPSMTPLLSRIGTAVLLLAVFVPAALWAPAWLWGILMAGVVGMAAYDWVRLSHFSLLSARVYAIVLTLCALVLPYGLAGDWPIFQRVLIVLAIVFWLLVAPLWLLGRWEASRVFVRAASGVVLLLPTWAALLYLHARGPAG